MLKINRICLLGVAALLLPTVCLDLSLAQNVSIWMTTDNQKTVLKQQPSISFSAGSSGEVGQGALAGFVAFAPAFAEEDGGWRVAVGDGFDVHGSYYAYPMLTVKDNNSNYMGTFPQKQLWPAVQ